MVTSSEIRKYTLNVLQTSPGFHEDIIHERWGTRNREGMLLTFVIELPRSLIVICKECIQCDGVLADTMNVPIHYDTANVVLL
jgi:hypothetical protein